MIPKLYCHDKNVRKALVILLLEIRGLILSTEAE